VARLSRPTHGLPVVFPELCQHCPTPACVDACIAGALSRQSGTGKVVLDSDRCVGCWSCIMACPFAAVRRDLRGRPLSARCDRCEGFHGPACVAACPTLALQRGAESAFDKAARRPEGMSVRVLAALVCLILPVAGLVAAHSAQGHGHAVGIAAGGAMAAAFLLPLLGWLSSSIVRRGVWVRLHLWAVVVAATAASVHAQGKLPYSIQSFALMALYAIVLTGVAYLYVRPLLLMLESASMRRARTPGDHPRLLALDAAARRGRARLRRIRLFLRLLDACKVVHIVLAVLAVGLVAAHVLVMTVIGGG